jgi:DNA polymerase I-like protein with 3'-5' exonuclease and polymerase domains
MGEAVIVMKEALVQLAAAGLSKYLRLPYHDEIIAEVPEEYVQEYINQALPIMTRWDYTVPLTCEVNVYDKLGDHYRE